MCDYNFVLTWLHAEYLVSWDKNLPHLFLLNSIRDSGTLIDPVLLTSRLTKDRSWHSCMLMPVGLGHIQYTRHLKRQPSLPVLRGTRRALGLKGARLAAIVSNKGQRFFVASRGGQVSCCWRLSWEGDGLCSTCTLGTCVLGRHRVHQSPKIAFG